MSKSAKKKDIVLEEIIDNIPYFVFWKDSNSNYLGCNKSFALSAGFSSPEEMVGKTDYDACWSKEESDFFRKIDKQVMESDEAIINFEEPQQQLDGTTKTVMTSKVPLHDNEGKVIGILGIYTDITDRKRLEEEKDQALISLKAIQQQLIHAEKMKSLGEMASGIAHEINNPLAIITGAVSLLKSSLSDDTIQKEASLDLLNDIESTVSRISEIVKSMRTISRHDSTSELEIRPTVLNEVIQDCVVLCEQKFKDLDIEFKLDLPNTPQPQILCHRGTLSQALINLLNNARDAVTEVMIKKITIRVRFADGCKISVIDSGAGISDSVKEKIFHPFFTTKDIGKGTGIGLSLSKSLLEKQNANLELEESNEGTCFSISFPHASII